MPTPSSNADFMRLALAQGRLALPKCLPNPPVGCVLVKDNAVISQGHTQPPGHHHAEAMALGNLSGDCSGVTAFVTLEPRSACWQRTRPKTWPSFWCASRSRLAGDGRQR